LSLLYLARRYLPLAAIVAVIAALFAQTRHYGLIGFDSYPILVASRIQSFADLIGTFTERLMDGRYAGEFYRPLLNLTFASDHSIWGLNAFGYQLTNVLVLGVWAWALHGLLRRLLGSASYAPFVGLLVFLLSGLQFEVLPVAARRADLLCGLFMVVALWVQLSPRVLDNPRPSAWPALATLLAVASKETAFALPVLIAVAVALYSNRTTLKDRLRHAVVAAVPPLIVIASMLAARFAVLQGLGGHRSLSAMELVSGIPRAVSLVAQGLVWPQPALMRTGLGIWLVVVLGLGLLATGIWVSGLDRGRRNDRAWRGAALGASWVVLLASTYSAAGQVGPWYFLVPLVGWAVLAACLIDLLVNYLRGGDRVLGGTAAVTLAVLVTLLGWQAGYSPLFRHYDEWQRATAASDAFFEEVGSQVRSVSDGSVVDAPPLPFWAVTAGNRPAIRGAAILADYSVQAWADLTWPDRNVRVIESRTPIDAAAPHEVVLRISERLAGHR
jgi:hypothetical protein